MSDLNDLLNDLALESGVLAPVGAGDALQEVLEDEIEVAQTGNLAQHLEHAGRAEDIAEQLDVLADRAEAQAQEDTQLTVAQISAESLHREFAAIMIANKLNHTSTSFESAYDTAGQLQGLSRDARQLSGITRTFTESQLDYSPEGGIVQFLRRDKARLKKAHDALAGANSKLTEKKGELSKEPVAVSHDGLKRFLIVDGHPVSNAKSAIEHDIAWLKKAQAAVNKAAAEIGSTLAGAHGEGDHSGAVEKLKSIADGVNSGLEAKLLGNHAVGESGKRGGGEKGLGFGQRMLTHQVVALKELPKTYGLVVGGATIGAALGASAGSLPGAILGTALGAGAGLGSAARNVSNKTKQAEHQKLEGTDAKSCASAGDLQKIAQELLALSSATDFSMDGKVEEAGEKLEGAPADVKAAGKKALAVVSKTADVVYEHAIYLTVKSAQLLSAAASHIA